MWFLPQIDSDVLEFVWYYSLVYRLFLYCVILTEFAAFEPVEGFEEGALLMCFVDLRQLLDLFMTEDWSTYFHDYGSESSKYLRVNPNNAVVIVEK